MARRKRQDVAGWFHHVFNRGQSRRPVFECRRDWRYFLAQVARQVRMGRIQLHTYSLLTNHYHLLLRSLTGELSLAMARIQNSYVRWYNRDRGRTGSLFESRFVSRPVLSDAYWHAVHEYIDANPVSAGIVTNATSHPAGSAWHYSRAERPRWLTRTRVERTVIVNLGLACYQPELYASWCQGVRDKESLQLVRSRMHHPPYDHDPLDTLAQGSEQALIWLRAQAKLADGRDMQPPLASSDRVLETIAHHRLHRPEWQINTSVRPKPAWLVMSVGLLSQISRTRSRDIARALSIAEGSVHNYSHCFAQLIKSDAEFSDVSAGLVTEIVGRRRT